MQRDEENVLSAILGRLHQVRTGWEPFQRARAQSAARLAELRAERRADRLLTPGDREDRPPGVGRT